MTTTTVLQPTKVFLLAFFVAQVHLTRVLGFAPNNFVTFTPSTTTTTRLFMGKSINKQAELRKKMELAKQQKGQSDDAKDSPSENAKDKNKMSDQEIKERNDRKRFEELLQTAQASAVWNDYASSDSYLNHKQVQQELDAQRQGMDRIFEGDPAPIDCFSDLLDIRTGQALDEKAAADLVPSGEDYRIILCDPRGESDDLRQAAKDICADLSPEDRLRLLVINADSPAENRRWLKKQPLPASCRVVSDPERRWMRTYTALGNDRWSMTLFLVSNGKVQKLIRDLNVYSASQATRKLLRAFASEPRL